MNKSSSRFEHTSFGDSLLVFTAIIDSKQERYDLETLFDDTRKF